jgi:hypothetical protein
MKDALKALIYLDHLSLDMFKLWAKIQDLVVKSIICGLESMR